MELEKGNHGEAKEAIEETIEEFYRHDLLLPKLNRLFHARRHKQAATSKTPRRIKPTLSEEKIINKIAHSTGYSQDQVCYFFFHRGLKKEQERDSDKYDLSKKVRSIYTNTIETEFEKFRAAYLAEHKRITEEDRQLLLSIHKQVNLQTRVAGKMLVIVEILRSFIARLTSRLPEFRENEDAFEDYQRRAELKAIEITEASINDEMERLQVTER